MRSRVGFPLVTENILTDQWIEIAQLTSLRDDFLPLSANGGFFKYRIPGILGADYRILGRKSRDYRVPGKPFPSPFSDCLMASGRRCFLRFLTYLAWSVNYRPKSRKTRFLEKQILGMLTSRNFSGLSILMSEISHENFI